MFLIQFLLIAGSALAGTAITVPRNLPPHPLLVGPDKPFFGVSDKDVMMASCRRDKPFTLQEMIQWLEAQARSYDGRSELISETQFSGLEFTNESAYLLGLLEALLKTDAWSDLPQGVYSNQCDKVICTAQELFGERVGVQLLFMLARYGFNGSHFRMKNSDLWTSEELDTVLLSLSDLPPHMTARPAKAMNHPLVHFIRADRSPGRPLANAVIYLYNNWNLQTPSLQRYTVFHELGHNIGFDFGHDSSADWYAASDWIDKDFEWIAQHPESKISHYAESNPDEDFAESFAAYRYSPEKLKRLNPKIYAFMKQKVFHNQEYISQQKCPRSKL